MSIVKGVALITGSAQGIGRGIALRLAKDGFDIGLNDIASKREQLQAVADDVGKLGRKAFVVPADVSVEEEVQGMVKEITSALGGLDVMVANAGIAALSPLLSTELELWDRIMRINARGPFLCYKYAAAQMIKQGRGGRIIGASSLAGKVGHPLGGAYGASKFAVRGLTQSAAAELGRYGITVNSYAPGVIQTPMTENLTDGDGAIMASDKESVDWLSGRINTRPIKHLGQPEDIASIVSYLASKEAHYITGQCISVDGGIASS
ncbi:hypothetical protein HYDPIDRAFT_30609 [Hydnomerulius pinastri MD-312]|uniref:3-oxoacyl-[acyl-carrier-protein] reductase n=1 Tax=Hydnomerulius pinastri MD-312 TaxID=994086 RepID=A0A0C9WDC3_9AGAM|nr:hypothetical protein HYDPIDRAFT_30609 [Hydnomerulius pinastri MD-312]